MPPPLQNVTPKMMKEATFEYHREVQHAVRAPLAFTGEVTCFKGTMLLSFLCLFFLLFFLFIPRRCCCLSIGSEHSPFFKAFCGKAKEEGNTAASTQGPARPEPPPLPWRRPPPCRTPWWEPCRPTHPSRRSAEAIDRFIAAPNLRRRRRPPPPLWPDPAPAGAHLPGPASEQHPVRHGRPQTLSRRRAAAWWARVVSSLPARRGRAGLSITV